MNQRAQYHVTNIARGTTDPGNSYQLKSIHIQLNWKIIQAVWGSSMCGSDIGSMFYWTRSLDVTGCQTYQGTLTNHTTLGRGQTDITSVGQSPEEALKKKKNNLQYKFINHFLQASISLSFIYIHAPKIPLAFEKYFVQITCAACIIYCCNFTKRDH